jgi:hypothetical protein
MSSPQEDERYKRPTVEEPSSNSNVLGEASVGAHAVVATARTAVAFWWPVRRLTRADSMIFVPWLCAGLGRWDR